MARDFLALVESVRRQGYDVRQTKRRGHWRIETPRGLIFTSGTPSDSRALRNLRAELRRHGVAL